MTLKDGVTSNIAKVECRECLRLLDLNKKAKEQEELRAAHDHEHLAIDAGSTTNGKCFLDIVCCARCGEDHAKVERLEFKRPVKCTCGMVNTHYCMCPTTGEPILARIISS